MKKFKKVLLHVGPDKTGSTSIQIACDVGRELLMKHGVFYPTGRWHAELGSCFSEAPERYIFNIQSGFKDREMIREMNNIYLSRLRKELEQCESDVLVLSYEGFVYIDEVSLIRFRDFIAEYSTTCEVVFYARSPLSYATSAMSQRVKSGLPSWPDRDPPVMLFRLFLERLGKVFGKEQLKVRKFARDALHDGDVVLDFLSLLNLPDAVLHEVASFAISENQALSREGMLIGERIINLLGDRVPSEVDFYHRFDKILSGIKGEKLRLNAEHISEIERVSKIHSDYLATEFGISFATEAYEADDGPPVPSPRMVDSLAALLLEVALPEVIADREISSPDLTLMSAVLREDKDVAHGQLITFDIDFILNRKIDDLAAGIHIFDEQNRRAVYINNTLLGQSHRSLPSGSYRVSYYLIANLPAGKYTAGFAFSERLSEDRQLELAWRDVMCEFQVSHQAGKTFASYSYLPAEISLYPTRLALAEMVVHQAIGSLLVDIPVSSMVPGEKATIGVRIVNRSEQVWVGDSFRPVRLSYHWLNGSGKMLVMDGLRSPLPVGGVAAGQTLNAELQVLAPHEAGAYILMLTLVQERVGWFESIGLEPARLAIEVMVPHEVKADQATDVKP